MCRRFIFFFHHSSPINQKFLQGVRKAQSAGRKANNTIGVVRKAPCAMRP
jgi:hypothetical protein